ncbi:MAG: rod shape-determining protein MreD [Anaerolineae bacterium]|nr:rod shape-determining protein MreD [Anaerolineae bacterium]
MGRYIGIPILALAAILNTTVMAEFRIGGGAPDLVLLLVVAWALLADLRAAMLWAVVGGVMQDSLSVAPLGTSALGLVIVAWTADTLFGQVHRHNIFIPPLVVIVGTVVYHLSMLFVLRLDGITVPLVRGLSYVTFPTVIYNTLLILPVFRLMGALHMASQPRRVRLE